MLAKNAMQISTLSSPELPNQSSIQVWMDKNHQFIATNQSAVRLFGYNNLEKIIGRKPEHILCPAAECAPLFIEQNEVVFSTKKPLIMMDIHPYADGAVHSFITTKTPLFNNKELFAVECQCIDLNESALNTFVSRLLSVDQRFNGYPKEQLSYVTSLNGKKVSLTRREEECVFFIIRGYSNKQIAQRLKLSPATVTNYIETVKNKFGCTSKQELIDCAIQHELVPFIPKSLLSQKNISLILND